MPCACRIGSTPAWSATPSSNWIETTVCGPVPGGGGGGGPAACQAKASGDVAVRSTAGSTVENDSMSSLNWALAELNCAKGSLSSGGQFRIPVRNPVKIVPFGPSTTAPFSTGGEPS